jgi:hypothetical protein
MGKQRWTPPSSDTQVETWHPPSSDLLVEDQTTPEKKSPSANVVPTPFSDATPLPSNIAAPSQSSSDTGNGSSLLEHGAQDLASIATGRVPISRQSTQGLINQEDESLSAVDHPRGYKDYERQAQADQDEDVAAGGRYTPQSLVSQFNYALAPVTDLAAAIVRPVDKLLDAVTPGLDSSKVNKYDAGYLFNWASDWLRSGVKENPLPDTFGGKLAGGVVQTIPAVIGAAASGGATAEGQAFNAIGDAASGYLTKSQIFQNALTQASGPLTRYLTLTKAAEQGTEAYKKSNGAVLPTLFGTLQGAQEGVESGTMLEGQMSAADQLGGKLFDLAVKSGVVNADGVVTQQALKSVVAAPFTFAASSVAEDLANGRPVDWTNAGVSAATALPFEAQHVIEAVGKGQDMADTKARLNENINSVMQQAQANSITNFATASPEEIHAALGRPETADELQVMALGKGVEAQNAQTLQDKNTLHLQQLELQKQADIKSVGQTIQTDGILGFTDAAGKSDLPDELKTRLLENADIAHKAVNPSVDVNERITANLKDGEQNAQNHIDVLSEANPNIAAEGSPEEMNALIDMVEARTDAQEKLLDHTEQTSKPAGIEIEPYEQELERLGYSKEEIARFPEEQKLHIVQNNIANEQGIIQKGNEASATEERIGASGENKSTPVLIADNISTSGNEGAPSNNEGNASISTTEDAHTIGDGNGTDATAQTEKPVLIGQPFTYQSKDHGLIDIQGLFGGKYRATFSDGTSDDFTRQEMHDFFGVEPERFDRAEKDNRLYATDHPEHVAQMYLDKLHELHDTGNPQSAIAQYGPRTTAKDFAQINDANNITPNIRMSYFKGEGKNVDLHLQADEINRLYFGGNPVVHAEDIANFMIDHPSGERTFFTPKGNPALKEIADRYYDLTGKKLFKTNVERIAGEATKEGVKTISEELHGPENTKLVNDILEDAFGEDDNISTAEWADKMRSQFDEYVKDPEEVFNIFHPVFDGAVLSEDQIKRVHEFITERQNGQEPGGRSNDQPANEPEGSGLGTDNEAASAEGAGNTEKTGTAETTQGAEGNADNRTAQELEDDLPFQKSNGDTIPEQKVLLAKGLLQKVLPGIEANFHDNVESFEDAMNKNGIEVHSSNLPNAFVGEDGVMHFNPEKINSDTQIHEYGHILTRWAEQHAPKLYEAMQRYGSEAKDIHSELKENGYFLSGKRLNDEAFVTMLGREGAGRLDEVIKNSGKRGVIKSFINDVWNKFQRYLLEKTGFDISKFKNIKNMGVQEFLNTINSKYLLSDTEISKLRSDQVNGANEFQMKKPDRNPGETMAEYARRLGEWKRDQYNNPQGRTRNELNRLFKPVREKIAELNRAFQEGVRSVREEKKQAFLEYDKYRKDVAKKNLSDLKAKWQEKLKAEKKASADKLADYKEATKQAFLEYDSYKKGETQKRLSELRTRYQEKVDAEKNLRQEQTEKLKSQFQNIRNEVNGILTSLHMSGVLGGVKFNDRDVLAFANQVNKITTEKGLDKFRDFVSKAVTSVDYMRDLGENRKLIKEAKGLLNKDYVPANIKSLIRELTSLNPNRVENPKELKTFLKDINDSQRAKSIPLADENQINDYINKEREFDIKQRGNDIVDTRNSIEESPQYAAVSEQKGSTLPDDYDIQKRIQRIVRDPELTHNEKVKKLGEISDALDEYDAGLRKSIDPITNEVTGQPEDFDKILEDIQTGSSSDRESLRDNLEDIAKAKQDAINTEDPGLSPEQKESLETLKNVPLDGETADNLRLYNNVLENVLLNDNHNGIGIFEAKAIGNSDEGALKLVNYLEERGRGAKEGRFKTKLGELRSRGAALSVIMTRIANNDFTFLNKLNTGTHFDEIRNGFAKAKQEYDNLIGKKIHAIFKEHPEIANSPESIQRLSLYSYFNQNREFSSPDQQNKELVKRISSINKDMALKSEEGLKKDNGEAAIEREVWNGFAQKIKEATGIDIMNKQELSGLKYADIKDLPFLNEGEKKIYDTYRDADEQLRDRHRDVVERQLNQNYEGWNNHMRDGYRFLNSGLIDVVGPDELGFTATNQNTTEGSTSTLQRVKGDPLATKSGEKQKVLNLNFFDVQNQNIKNQLEDIHTLKARQIFDSAIKNRDLRDALGNENHTLYKNTIRDYVLNSMGLNNTMGEKELRIVKEGLNFITKAGTFKQLLSLSALAKQGGATIFNTLATTGFDAPLMYKAIQQMSSESVQKLLKDHAIGERAENLAQLNTLNLEGISDVNNIVDQHIKSATSFFNRYFKHLEENGAHEEKFFTKPIKWGDVKSGEWAWVTYYAKHIIDTEGKKFEDIDWAKEAAHPNREAAEFAESMTSKQLNENTKAARSKFLNSGAFGDRLVKAFILPFGSFNLHKFQTMVENYRTLASKDTFVDENYRKIEAKTAAMSLVGALTEEAFFQGLKLVIGYGVTSLATRGITYALASLFGTDKEKQEALGKVDQKLEKMKDDAFQKWYTNTLGNYFFGGLGNAPQDLAQRGINDLTNSKFFYEPNISPTQQVQDANNYGMLGAAWNGNGDLMKDIYRGFINNNDKYGVPVNITPYQKSVMATSFLSNMLAMSGMNDADLNRSIESIRKQVEFSLASKFHEPNYEDISKPGPLKVGSKVIQLGTDHQEYYEKIKESYANELMAKGVDSKRASTTASNVAKAKLIEKYGLDALVKEGELQKKKK